MHKLRGIQSFRSDELFIHSIKKGIDGIKPQYCGGRPPTFTEQQRQVLVELAESRPKDWGYPLSQWSLSQLQVVFINKKKIPYINRPTIRTILREAGLTYQRTKTWKQSNGSQFNKKNG